MPSDLADPRRHVPGRAIGDVAVDRRDDRRRSGRRPRRPRGDRRPRPAPAPRRDRRPRPLQRARPHRTGRAGPPAHGRCWPAAAPPASRCRSTPTRRRSTARPSTPRSRRPTASSVVDFALWGGLAPRNLDRLERARRARRRRLQGVHVRQRDRGLPGRRRRHAPGRHGAGGGARPARGSSTPSGRRGCARRRAATGATWSPRARSTPSSRRSRPRSPSPRDTGCALHVVHVSSGEPASRSWRRADGDLRDLPALPRRCPRTTSRRSGRARSARRRCGRRAEVEALWREVEAGVVDLVASDHSPCPPEMKAGDFIAAWGGIAGRADDARHCCSSASPRNGRRADLGANPAEALQPPQGPARAGRRRRPRARRPARPPRRPSCVDRHRLSPFAGRPLPRIVRTLVRGGAARRAA